MFTLTAYFPYPIGAPGGLNHASPPPEKVSSTFVYWTLGAYGPSSQQTFTMSVSSQSQSSYSGTGDRDTPYLDRVRRNVLRLPEYKIREILANLKFQDTGLEPEDPDYEVKVQLIFTVLINEDKEKQAKGAKRQASKGFIPLSQIEHDVRMAWAEDRHKTKEKITRWTRKSLDNRNCCLSSRKSTNQQSAKDLQKANNLHVRQGKVDKNIMYLQDKAITTIGNGLEGLGRTQGADRIPGTGRGPSLGLGPGLSLGLQYMNH
ncbi:MAG: hypothetical protein EZS28_010991 [Streblomastix strix]|uniref:Uncharacterized protein n=1 Tax=Streblomastix strix TaxID=222440 RepID=A0A5J4WEZ7_9EUKA|nr:MAG: hypothetical protein EZS28_010991 [Streblomastix strix]